MHYLHNYRLEELRYDNKAYAFSATYHGTVLSLFAHHLTSPCPGSPDGRPEYWTTYIAQYPFHIDLDTFARGISAFRNLRDKALNDRIEAVNTVNAISMDDGDLEYHDTEDEQTGGEETGEEETGHFRL